MIRIGFFYKWMINMILFVILCAASSTAWGWGAYEAATWGQEQVLRTRTHQVLDTETRKFLNKDPAFKGIPFPTIGEILANEGAWAKGKAGPGPDKAPAWSK